jgi:hypothetical protein
MTSLSLLKIGLFGTALFLALPAFAESQTGGSRSGTNVEPSKGAESGGMAGQPGLPGNKSGPSAKQGEGSATEKMDIRSAKKGTAGGAPGVPGASGNKSGPAATPPE